MSSFRGATLLSLLVLGALTARGVPTGQDAQLDRASLNELLQNMGYEAKSLGDSETSGYEFVTGTDWKIYLSGQISTSKRYVWLLVNLGEVTEKTKFKELLQSNATVQPSQFYVTSSNRLQLAMPVENRGVDAVRMRTAIDAIVKALTDTQTVWAKE